MIASFGLIGYLRLGDGVLYVCEDCGKSLADSEAVRLEDGDTILCGECYKKAPSA